MTGTCCGSTCEEGETVHSALVVACRKRGRDGEKEGDVY